MKNEEELLIERKIKPFLFYGHSMLPYLNPKTVNIVLVRECREYKVGDIVAIKCFDEHFNYVIHRVVFKKQNKYITKGDNNLFFDKTISHSDIIGRADRYISYNKKSVKILHSSIIANISRFEEFVAQKNIVFGKVIHMLNKAFFKLIVFYNERRGI